MYEYSGLVTEIKSGNIIEINIALGFGIQLLNVIKLHGIETTKQQDAGAIDELTKLILNKEVLIRTYRADEICAYGLSIKCEYTKYSADIYCELDTGGLVCINDYLIGKNLAIDTDSKT